MLIISPEQQLVRDIIWIIQQMPVPILPKEERAGCYDSGGDKKFLVLMDNQKNRGGDQ
jgi:hypothetical protein